MPDHQQPAATEAPRLSADDLAAIVEHLDKAHAEVMDPKNMMGNSMIQYERVFRLADYLVPRWPQIRASLAAATARAEAAERDIEAVRDHWQKHLSNAVECIAQVGKERDQIVAALASERATSERLVEKLDKASACADILVRIVRPMYSGPSGDQGLNDPLYGECQRAIKAYRKALAQHARATEPAPVEGARGGE